MIRAICDLLQVRPADCIEYVEDRLGHDFRYAIDSGKIISQLNWTPKTKFKELAKMMYEEDLKNISRKGANNG